MTELIWDGKYDAQGRKVAAPRIALPSQTVEPTRKFMELVDQLEKDEDLKLDQFQVGKDRLVLADGSHRLVETKGREDPDVAHKDRAARLWCENAAQLTTQGWHYLKVPQAGFDRLQPTLFSDLLVFEA